VTLVLTPVVCIVSRGADSHVPISII
jgi:hypothetical protein